MTDDDVIAKIMNEVPLDQSWAQGEDEAEQPDSHHSFAIWCLNWIRRDWAWEPGMAHDEVSCPDEISEVTYQGQGSCGSDACVATDCSVILHVEFATDRESADITIPI